jgi:hypothetical protein
MTKDTQTDVELRDLIRSTKPEKVRLEDLDLGDAQDVSSKLRLVRQVFGVRG